MKKPDFSYISEIKTQPIYYFPLVFDDYEIITYFPPNEPPPPNGMPGEHEFIVEAGQHKSKNNLGGDYADYLYYEGFLKKHQVFSDAGFLQNTLTVSSMLVNESGYRKTICDEERKIALDFCRSYGLNNNSYFHLRIANGEPPPHLFGCSLWQLIYKLQNLYITFLRISSLVNGDCFEKDKLTALGTLSWGNSNLMSEGLFSSKENKLIQVLIAPSLIDVANFQLIKVMADGAFIRKCSNPKCPQMIVDGRIDKKTCSDSCRKAYGRYLSKNKRQGVNENGEHNKEDE